MDDRNNGSINTTYKLSIEPLTSDYLCHTNKKLMKTPQPILIPYGFAEWDSSKISVSTTNDDHEILECNSSHVLINQKLGVPLRLNNHHYNLRGQISMESINNTNAQFDYLCEHLKLFCGVWEKSQKGFLDCYFDFVSKQVIENRTKLERKLVDFGQLYNYRHWLFSALLPLPQAHINTSISLNMSSYNSESMKLVDFCFWNGEQIFAIVLADDGHTSQKVIQRNQSLRDAGVVVIELSKKFLRDANSNILGGKLLPSTFRHFWDKELIPSGAVKLSTFELPPWIKTC